MTKEQEEKIKRDIQENIGWLEDGKLRSLDEASLSTIMAILRINLGEST